MKHGYLDFGTLHTPLPARIRAMGVDVFGLIPTVKKPDSLQTGSEGHHSKICISEEGFLILFGDHNGTRSLQCKPTMSTNLWKIDMEDWVIMEMCSVRGRQDYLALIIETPKSIQLRSMKTGKLLYTYWIRFQPGKMCFLKNGTFLVINKSENSNPKLVEFKLIEKLTDDRVLKVKLEKTKKTLKTQMKTEICGVAPFVHQGRLLVAMVSRMNDLVQAIDYMTGEIAWTNKIICDDLQSESISLCKDGVGFLYIIDKLCKRILWVSANGKEKKKLTDIASVSNIECASWDNSQQRLFLLVVDHKGQEWLKGYRVTHTKPGLSAEETKPTENKNTSKRDVKES